LTLGLVIAWMTDSLWACKPCGHVNRLGM